MGKKHSAPSPEGYILASQVANDERTLKDPRDAKPVVRTLVPPAPQLNIAETLETTERDKVILKFKSINSAIDAQLVQINANDTYKLNEKFDDILSESYEPIFRAKIRAFQLQLETLFSNNELEHVNKLLKELLEFVGSKQHSKILFLEADDEQIKTAVTIEKATKEKMIRHPYDRLRVTIRNLAETVPAYKDELVALLEEQTQNDFLKKVLALAQRVKRDYSQNKGSRDITNLNIAINDAVRIGTTPEIAKQVFTKSEPETNGKQEVPKNMSEQQVSVDAPTLSRTLLDPDTSSKLIQGIEEPILLTRQKAQPFELTRKKFRHHISTARSATTLYKDDTVKVPNAIKPIETQKSLVAQEPTGWLVSKWNKLKGWFSTEVAPHTPVTSPKRVMTGWRSSIAIGILGFLGLAKPAQPTPEHHQENHQPISQTIEVVTPATTANLSSNSEDLKAVSTTGSPVAGLAQRDYYRHASIQRSLIDGFHRAPNTMWEKMYGEVLDQATRDALTTSLAHAIRHTNELASFHVGTDFQKETSITFMGLRNTGEHSYGKFHIERNGQKTEVEIRMPDPNAASEHHHSYRPIDLAEQATVNAINASIANTNRLTGDHQPFISRHQLRRTYPHRSPTASIHSSQLVDQPYQQNVNPNMAVPADSGFDYRYSNTPDSDPSMTIPAHQPRANYTSPTTSNVQMRMGERETLVDTTQREQTTESTNLSLERASVIANRLNMFAPDGTNPFEAAGHDASTSITFSLGNLTVTFDQLMVRNGQVYCHLGAADQRLDTAIRTVINERPQLTPDQKQAIIAAAVRILSDTPRPQKVVSQDDLDALAQADRHSTAQRKATLETRSQNDHAANRALEELRTSDQIRDRLVILEQKAQDAEAQGSLHIAEEIRKNARATLSKHPRPDNAQRNR